MSLYGKKQARHIWGSFFHNHLMKWGFKLSLYDPFLYFLQHVSSVIIVLLVVDDISLGTNDANILEELKATMMATYDVKLYVELKNVFRWNNSRSPARITVNQSRYGKQISQSLDYKIST